MSDNPRAVSVWGRLSWPSLTAAEAYTNTQKSKYPEKDVASARPFFTLVLTQGQFEKARDHVVNKFLPYCVAQFKAEGMNGKNALEPAEAKELIDFLTGDLSAKKAYTPFKPVHEKTLALMPDAVATIKVVGKAGIDLTQIAKVYSESELKIPDPDQIVWPCAKPIDQTVHTLYPGCEAFATLDLYTFHIGHNPGFSAGSSTIAFRGNAERFGGGAELDTSELLLD